LVFIIGSRLSRSVFARQIYESELDLCPRYTMTDRHLMEGDGAHGDNDHADGETLTPRAYLLARKLVDVGRSRGEMRLLSPIGPIQLVTTVECCA
jgi:hypothetical protein